MDLMTLAAKIVLDDSQFQKGISGAEKAGGALSQKMSALTIAAGNIATDMIRNGFGAIKEVIGGAMSSYADYQQLIGGVETLFKQSSNTVAKYAKQSYKTTGLSANQYMETVTSFSASLLQGLNGDTEAAAELANTAIIDMSDNANKMGTDMGMIQNAYQGFAKQNYTMLDNLKLGYGGTASEMIRLINDSKTLDHEISSLDGITFDQIVRAIHAVQTEMGITGTTAKEAADTISGSKSSLAAAWKDMLSAVGGEGDQERLDETLQNFKDAFSTYMENFIPTLVQSIGNSGDLVEAIAESIASLPTTLLSDIGENALEAGTEVVGGLSKITGWVISSITEMFKKASIDPSAVADFGAAIGDFIGTAIADIVKNAPAILDGIVDVGIALAGGLLEGLFKGLFGEGAEVDKIKDQLDDELFSADMKNTEASAILKYMESLSEKYGAVVTSTQEWAEAAAALEKVMPDSGKVFEDYGSNIQGALDKLKAMNQEMRRTAIMNALMGSITDMTTLLTQQTQEYNTAEARYNRLAQQQKDYEANARQAIMDSAARRAEEYYAASHDAEGNLTGNGIFDENYYMDLQNFAKGMDEMGDSLETYNWDELMGIAQKLSDPELTKSIEDERQLFETATNDMNTAKSTMEESAKEIEATKTALSDAQTAMDQTVADMDSWMSETTGAWERGGEDVSTTVSAAGDNAAGAIEGSGESASGAIASSGGSVAGALSGVAAQIGSITIPIPGTSSFSYMPQATGIENVPFNGFRAELHKGEMVLTASEARRMREGGGGLNYSALQDAVRGAILEGMRGATVRSYISGRDITDDVNRNTIRQLKARRFAT